MTENYILLNILVLPVKCEKQKLMTHLKQQSFISLVWYLLECFPETFCQCF